MAAILIVDSDYVRATALEAALSQAGHRVEICPDSFSARHHLTESIFDLLIVDAGLPDAGNGILMAQVHLAWPLGRILALIDPETLSRSKIHEMGLWRADIEVDLSADPGAVSFAAFRLIREAQLANARRDSETVPAYTMGLSHA